MEPIDILVTLIVVAAALAFVYFFALPWYYEWKAKKLEDEIMAELREMGKDRRPRERKGRPKDPIIGKSSFTKDQATLYLKENMSRIRRAKNGRIGHTMHGWLLKVARMIKEAGGVVTKRLKTEELFLTLYVMNRTVYTNGVNRGDILWAKNYLLRVIVVHRNKECGITFLPNGKRDGKFRNCFEVTCLGNPELVSHIPLAAVRSGDLERPGKPLAKAVLRKYLPSGYHL